MKFGLVPTAKAEGGTLAHSIAVDGARFGKGRILSAADLQALMIAGHNDVTVARLNHRDVPENAAAARIAAKLASANITPQIASTGRVNLHAENSGLFDVNPKIINEINALHPSITVSTLPRFTVCKTGAMVATVKIIPFAAPEKSVAKAELIGQRSAFYLNPFLQMQIGLIQTTLPLTKNSVLEKTVEVTRQRLNTFGSGISAAAECNHDSQALAHTLEAMSGLDMLIIFGASAVCDVNDVIPAAIRLAGGKVLRVGMPVDPGNLLVLGNCGNTIIIGAPGCARSPKENGFDWVLARLFAGIKIKPRDIIEMGVGGLLMEIASRPSPRGSTNINSDTDHG